jgi:hypothetical protein
MSVYDKFNFDNFDLDAMREDLKAAEAKPGQRTNDRSDKYVVLPNSECVLSLRILPPRPGERKPYAQTCLHYINKRAYHCLREKVDGKWRGNCPICNYYNALYRKADDAKTKGEADRIKNIAKKFKPVQRNYYNVVIRELYDTDTKKTLTNIGPRIWAVGKSLHAKILRAMFGNEKFKQPPLGNIWHPLSGYDFTLVKQISTDGESTYPNYDESGFDKEPSMLGTEDQVETWLNALYDLERERLDELKTYDELYEQVEIVQGKKADPSVGFNSEDFDLPDEDLVSGDDEADDVPVERPPVRRSQPAVFEAPAPVARKVREEPAPKRSLPKEDVSFDLDLDATSGIDIDDKWVKDLQRAVNEAV